MPGVGVGGLISGLFDPGLDTRLAQHITPNPNPLAQQGPGPQNPKAVDSLGNPVPAQAPAPNLAPAAVTQPDPVNASYAADLLKAHRMDALSADLNRNIEGMAAGFGTAQQQASKQAALARAGGGVGDSIGALSSIQAMQDQTIKDNEHARFMGNAAVFAQTLSQSLGRPVSIDEATEIMNSPDLMREFGQAAGANATTTTTQKDAEAATRAWAEANPKATAQDIADYKANLIAGGMTGGDLETRQYLDEKRKGLTTDDYATWKGKKAAEAAAATTEAKAATDFKDTARTDYTANTSKLKTIQPYIDTLTNDPESARKALATFSPTTGKWGELMPDWWVDPKVKAAANALQKIQAELTAEGLKNVKNVRNAREFNTLGQAATGGLNAAASQADFNRALDDLKNKYLDAEATTELAVGHRLSGELVGHGDQDLTSPTINGKPNPYYNGGGQDFDDLSQMSEADAMAAASKLPKGRAFKTPDGQYRVRT
jgi:hypothetical protein